MRKQYHFRKSPAGLLGWDVDRLVELTRGMTPEDVPLSEITELDEAYWFGDGVPPDCRNVAEHAKLILESDLAFPVILSSDGRVMDGMHRICKALIEGRESVRAFRLPIDPPPDHIGIAPEDLPY